MLLFSYVLLRLNRRLQTESTAPPRDSRLQRHRGQRRPGDRAFSGFSGAGVCLFRPAAAAPTAGSVARRNQRHAVRLFPEDDGDPSDLQRIRRILDEMAGNGGAGRFHGAKSRVDLVRLFLSERLEGEGAGRGFMTRRRDLLFDAADADHPVQGGLPYRDEP
ncbi:MAG: hypothetical protein MZV70_67685, partial [Desulfobacterales bacterium]|nr:hypothetical protein [Desulfobacterales bacterium]